MAFLLKQTSDNTYPKNQSPQYYGSLIETPLVKQQNDPEDASDTEQYHDCETFDHGNDEEDDDDDEAVLRLQILERVQHFTLAVDPDKAYRAKELRLSSLARPHMRTFHASWMLFLCSWFVWFSMVPLLPYIQASTNTSDAQIWNSNMYSMVGAVILRLLLGPLCDQYGARGILTGLLAFCALPLLFAGLLIHDYYSLLIVRFWIGCVGGTLVPAQYWITSHFCREVCGKAMAVCAGWGAMGGGLAQVIMGTWIYPTLQTYFDNDDDKAWRVALVVPASIALGVAYYFYYHSDDCPLGNLTQCKKAGLVQERSAVDSFRSGAVNLNAWFLFFQFAASLGIELTVESSATLHLANRFDLELADAAAYASLFGIMNIFSRGLGGVISDKMHAMYSLRGRLIVHMIFMLCEGILIFYFVRCGELNTTLVAMVAFAIFGQMSMGTCFGIVPYVDGPNTGTIAGIVGAGGNVGAVIFLNVFKSQGDSVAFTFMATFSLAAALLTPLIVIKGYRGILFGKERKEKPAMLTVPVSGSY